jgi:hypothetical protein
MVITSFVRNCAATCADRSTNKRTLAPAQQSANNRATRRRSNYNLRARMVAMVARPLRRNRMPMPPVRCALLSIRRKRNRKYASQCEYRQTPFKIHTFTSQLVGCPTKQNGSDLSPLPQRVASACRKSG